ncbi:hypothetical protein C8R43DRAFT_1235747 [Mycena crocata]|nr:hypothetical protein C8R43DRAFT_1235747 [Mycena crocata]
MAEALFATEQRKPFLITDTDQLLITGDEPPSLESLLESIREAWSTFKRSATHSVSTAFRPIFFHITRLPRELYGKITGDYARRSPVAETAVVNLLSALTLLQSITTLLFSEDVLQIDHQTSLSAGDRRDYEDVRMTVSTMCLGSGFTGLALALHNEMKHRAATDMSGVSRNDWAQQRTALLRQQAHSRASSALDDLDRALVVLSPWLGAVLFGRGGCRRWHPAYPDRSLREVLVSRSSLVDSTPFRTLVERMDAHIAVYRAAASNSFPTQPPGLPADDAPIG